MITLPKLPRFYAIAPFTPSECTEDQRFQWDLLEKSLRTLRECVERYDACLKLFLRGQEELDALLAQQMQHTANHNTLPVHADHLERARWQERDSAFYERFSAQSENLSRWSTMAVNDSALAIYEAGVMFSHAETHAKALDKFLFVNWKTWNNAIAEFEENWSKNSRFLARTAIVHPEVRTLNEQFAKRTSRKFKKGEKDLVVDGAKMVAGDLTGVTIKGRGLSVIRPEGVTTEMKASDQVVTITLSIQKRNAFALIVEKAIGSIRSEPHWNSSHGLG